MKITPLAVPDVLLIEPTLHEDARGSFVELFNERRFREHDLSWRFVQDNVSRSKRGVIRGLHYQRARPQGKLISVMEGAIFDVAVDIRVGSPTFAQWVAMELEAGDGQLLSVRHGFAHGLTALTDGAAVLYECSDFYVTDDPFGILFDDPELAIHWPCHRRAVWDPVRRPRVGHPLAGRRSDLGRARSPMADPRQSARHPVHLWGSLLRVAVTGANGQLGRALVEAIEEAGHDGISLTRGHLNLEREDVEKVVGDLEVDWIAHRAAYTAVARPESSSSRRPWSSSW